MPDFYTSAYVVKATFLCSRDWAELFVHCALGTLKRGIKQGKGDGGKERRLGKISRRWEVGAGS